MPVFIIRWLLLSAALLLAAPTVNAQSNPNACDVAGETAAKFRALPPMTDLSKSWEDRMAPRRALARSAPADWPLQIALQDAILRAMHLAPEWDAAVAGYRQLPDRALGQLLEGRLLSGVQRQRSRALLDAALAAAPDSPWIHLALVEWAAHPMQRDAALAARHFEQWRKLCPQSLRGFVHFDVVRDVDRFGAHLRALRELIDARKTAGLQDADLAAFRPLWTWESALANAAPGRAPFEERVRADLAAIRALGRSDSPEWAGIVRYGYEHVLKDQQALAAYQADTLRDAPRSEAAWWIEDERSRKTVNSTRMTDSTGIVAERVGRFGDTPSVRFGLRHLVFDPSVSSEDFVRYAERLLVLDRRYPETLSVPPSPILIAEQYARRKVRLDRVPALVEEGLRLSEEQEKYLNDSDVLPFAQRPVNLRSSAMVQRRAAITLIRHALATAQPERAKLLLADFRKSLLETKPADTTTRDARPWAGSHGEYLELAREAGIPAEPLVPDATPAPFEASARIPVAEFTAQDLTGKTWRHADLKGKVTYVSVWTTWCAPCRAEMPALQKLHERWKNRPDRAVLTISADSHRDLARDFLRQHGYTLPVIHGIQVASKFFPPVSFPQNWLIDADGRRVDARAPGASDATLGRIEQLADLLDRK